MIVEVTSVPSKLKNTKFWQENLHFVSVLSRFLCKCDNISDVTRYEN